MLPAIKQSRRYVVDLNNADIDSIACANIDTASERRRKPRVFFSEISRTRCGSDGDTQFVVDFHAIANVHSTHESVDEWLERCFRGVVFDLNTSQIVYRRESTSMPLKSGPNANRPAFVVSGKIKLESKVARDIAGN